MDLEDTAHTLVTPREHSGRKWLLLAALMAIGIGGVIWWNIEAEKAERAAYEAAVAVVALPSGVEQEWIEFIDRRLQDRIRVVGESFLVKHWLVEDQEKYLSRGMSYSVECARILSITFASGDVVGTDVVIGILPSPITVTIGVLV